MYLVLGSPHDPCCARVHDAIARSGRRSTIIANPLVEPARFAWQIDDTGASGRWTLDGDVAEPVEGVLVRGGGWIDPDGWQPNDLAYAQAEMHAALVAWLRGLTCPVINRYTADLWYRPQMSLLSWRHLLWTCGLPTPDAIVSNVEAETRAFAREVAVDGIDGVVYTPLTSEARYLVATNDDWAGLAALQQRTPVCLTRPHGAPQLACVVDGHVVWNEAPDAEAARLAPALRRFASRAGLAFVEVALAPATDGIVISAIDHHPRLDRYSAAAQALIVDALVHALTADAALPAHELVPSASEVHA